MSHPRNKVAHIRWCPWCGLDRLERDQYKTFQLPKVEFICLSCGAAFRVLGSTRKQDAERMMAHERKLRVPTPTNPKVAQRVKEDQWKALCAKKFREFKHVRQKENRNLIGEDMKAWMESEDGQRAWANLV